MNSDTKTQDEDLTKNLGQNQAENDNQELVGRFRNSPVSISVFKRETENGQFYNFVPQRVYTENDGDSFDYTNGFRPRDLRKLADLLRKAADDAEEVEFVEAESGGGQ